MAPPPEEDGQAVSLCAFMSTEEFGKAIGIQAASIRVHLCRRGSYYGIRPRKAPNGRLLWPGDAVERFLSLPCRGQENYT